ncbi:hypothetical protein [Amycolatopsis jejuensis]|uniref:VG15 protein n=1 Tax=Amycolatopsis jejuensis TaxID=330084 RepID=UPI0005265A63|nr:hypothetical protein [Amycolatopsis jejuensis]
MTPLDRARSHHAARARLAKAARADGRRLWRQVEPRAIEESWLSLLMRMFVAVSQAQLTAARQADHYTAEALRAQGYRDPAAGRVAAEELAGISSDGRPLETLLMGPVFAAKAAIAKGATSKQALAVGQIRLDLITRTQVADAGRVADGIAVVARPTVSWTRMVVGDSCPRCIILAGRVYRYSQGFERHPQCDCVHIPTAEDTGDDFTTDPRRAFEEGRVKGLSKADDQAIRDGADMAQIVNAHKGMYVAGARKLTRTGITRRGTAGRRLGGRARLMPEQIYREASSREEAVQLLCQHGYIV